MPLTRRQIFVRRRIVVSGIAVATLATAFYLPLTLLAPLPETTPELLSHDSPAAVAPVLSFPAYGASGLGAVGYPGVLAMSGTDKPLPIASISKVITALVVLEAKPLSLGEPGPIATFTTVDEAFYDEQVANDGVVEAVSAGQQMSERNMLDIALMASANNYAQSVAAWAFGSEAAYVVASRDWIARHGLSETTIADATGINPKNTSSVANLIEIAKLALEHPVIAEIVATKALTVPGVGVVTNRNELLGVDGVDGIKTGTLEEAGSCLLFSAELTVAGEKITLVGVVLGGPNHKTIDAAIRSLIAQANEGFVDVALVTEGDKFAQFETEWGDDSTAVAASSASIVVWSAIDVSLVVDVEPVHLAEAGEKVGELTFSVGERTVTVALELDELIDDPGPWWRLTNPTRLF